MEDYNNKTKAELLEIIQNLEKSRAAFLRISLRQKERFRDRYSNRILDNLPDMLTVLDRDANIVELVSSPSTNHVEGTTADSITQSNIKIFFRKMRTRTYARIWSKFSAPERAPSPGMT